jgi:hypothetical protein
VAVVEQKGERRGFWQGLAMGSSSSPRFQPDTTRVDLCQDFLAGLGKRSKAGKLLGWFALEEKERKKNRQRLGYAWLNSNLNFEFLQNRFENLPRIVSRGF